MGSAPDYYDDLLNQEYYSNYGQMMKRSDADHDLLPQEYYANEWQMMKRSDADPRYDLRNAALKKRLAALSKRRRSKNNKLSNKLAVQYYPVFFK